MDLSKKRRHLLFLGLVGFVVLSGETLGAATCYRVGLEEAPSWLSSAASLEDRPGVVLVDVLRDKLVAYDPSGRVLKLPEIPVQSGRPVRPTEISATNHTGYLLEIVDGVLVRLDKQLHTIGKPFVLRNTNEEGYRVGWMNQWKVAGSSLVAYGALVKTPEEIASGFFRVSLAEGRPEMLMPLEDAAFYLHGDSYIATIGSTSYFVAMTKHPAIYKIAARAMPEKLSAFPHELSVRPELKTRLEGPRSAIQRFAELQTLTYAAGLYAQGAMLYLLGRQKDGWYLYAIDPDKDRLAAQGVHLPTSAIQLGVVPTPTGWYFVERGAVRQDHRQEIRSMLAVDSSSPSDLATLPHACPTVRPAS